MGIVDTLITPLGQSHHLLPQASWDSIHRQTAPVPVSQGSGPLLPIRSQEPPSMAFTNTENLCCLMNRPITLQYPIQYL